MCGALQFGCQRSAGNCFLHLLYKRVRLAFAHIFNNYNEPAITKTGPVGAQISVASVQVPYDEMLTSG
jgi:hypothetical protein